MSGKTYYMVHVSQYFTGRDIADCMNFSKRRESKDEAMELSQLYKRRYSNAQVKVVKITEETIAVI